MSTTNNNCDVAIVGGGLVGASLAAALAPLGLRIAVVEAVAFRSNNQPSYDDRILAVGQGSKRILAAMGVWPGVRARDATPIKHIHISDRGGLGMARLNHDRFGVEAFGYVVPARVFGQALLEHVAMQSNLDLICPAEVGAMDAGADGVSMQISRSGAQFRLDARLAVLADGGGDLSRKYLDLKVRRRCYGQTAILSTVTASHPQPNTAFERFTKDGPLALLPTSGDRYGVVRTARAHQVDALLALSNAAYIRDLQQRFGDRVGALDKLGRRSTHELSLVRVEQRTWNRAVVIGNAAHTIHPVAGQGFNLGLRDVAVLAEVIAETHRSGHDIGANTVLEKYHQWRQRDIRRVSCFTDGLIQVFANDFKPMVAMRNSALLALNLIPGAQAALVRRTMGLASSLPRLARGLPIG